MRPVHRFAISATEGRHTFEVILFKSRASMLRWTNINHPQAPKEFNALTCSIGHPCDEGELGRLLFSAESFAPSIIQHELLHAAFAYERRVYGNEGGGFPTPESEERICHTQQDLLDDLLDDLLFKMDEMGLQEFGCQ